MRASALRPQGYGQEAITMTFDPDAIISSEEWETFTADQKIQYMGAASLNQLESALKDASPAVRERAIINLNRRRLEAMISLDSYILGAQRDLQKMGLGNRAALLDDPKRREEIRLRRVIERQALEELFETYVLLKTFARRQEIEARQAVKRDLELDIKREAFYADLRQRIQKRKAKGRISQTELGEALGLGVGKSAARMFRKHLQRYGLSWKELKKELAAA
jgi:hypothetical protein